MKFLLSRFSSLELFLLIIGGFIALAFIGVMIYIGATSAPPEVEDDPLPRTDIVTIAGNDYNISLTSLTLEWIPLTRNDMLQISLMTDLTRLEIKMCEITDITPLARLLRLERLDLRFNEISDVSPLVKLENLTHLNLSHNDISNISALSHLTNLTMLDVSANRLSDISALYNMTQLKNLFIYDNAVDSNGIPFLDEHLYGDLIRAQFPDTTIIHF